MTESGTDTGNNELAPIPRSLEKWLDQFAHYQVGERALSAHTVQNYQRQLQHMARYFVSLGITSWQQIEPNHVRLLATQSKRHGLKPASIRTQLSALRSFLDYLIRQNQLSANPAKGVSAPKADKPLPKNLDVDEVNQLLNVTDDEPLSIRDRAMMELMYGAGLRLSELTGLDLKSVSFHAGEVRVLGKGSKQRLCPISGEAVIWLKNWLKIRGQFAAADESALFVSSRGQRISQRNVQKRMAEWGQKQSLHSHINPHKLRHSYATHMLESSGDLRAVQELLGHANLSTTQIYTHLDFDHLAKVYDQAHPRARKRGARESESSSKKER
ncbi:Tyrosine recombinase XerC [Vibrio stylophorae]|uniref:Tyrosine recombinase XerC n=1 Tax=Vibrio stylophorae TaxID=659351 RepID=A0ABM8ZWK9_9VIBR|nr:tyrosine recombinase XerC [Vibrio stylophorae]CAH0534729.1 Tyrosine recombinase XerC [Vibrio stylophorae]